MNLEMHNKIGPTHLQRQAYLYVRQSTLRQVLENTESTKRQYALRERAVALGWPQDRIVVIDSDLGQSGADSDRRRLPEAGGRGRHGRGWRGARPGGLSPGAQLVGLAPAAGDLRAHRHAHPRRGWAVQPRPLQRPSAARPQRAR